MPRIADINRDAFGEVGAQKARLVHGADPDCRRGTMLATTRLSVIFCVLIALAGCSASNSGGRAAAGAGGTSSFSLDGLSGSPALIAMAGVGGRTGSSGKGGTNASAGASAAT